MSWSLPALGRITFGRGCTDAIAEATRSFGQRCMVCTDAPLVEAGIVGRLVPALRDGGLEVTVFEGGAPEVNRRVVEACAEQALAGDPQVLVGVGGGSNMDLAKAVGVLLAHGGQLSDYYGENKVPGPTVPVVAIPTTAGTGSEVTPVAVIQDDALPLKVGIASRHLIPDVALVDPELTLSCPPGVTSHSGLDALSHAIEAFVAASYDTLPHRPLDQRIFVGKNPVSDTLALRAVELIGRHLVRACEAPADLAAREGMLLASLLGGMAFASAGTGLVHALQYPIGSLTKTPHGLGNALLMPSVVAFNLRTRPDRYGAIAAALGPEIAPGGLGALPQALLALNRRLNLPADLLAIGVAEEDLRPVAASALKVERLVRNNPVPVDEDDLVGILRDAWDRTSLAQESHG